MSTLTARLASVSLNSEAVSQAGHGAAIEAEGGSVLPHVTASQKIVKYLINNSEKENLRAVQDLIW